MCGITGIIAFTDPGISFLANIDKATRCLSLRGPDNEGIYRSGNVVFGHRRLSVIDVSEAANQPFTDTGGRYTIIFNGEFFNYKEHRDALLAKGEKFQTQGDTEVLLRLYMLEGPNFLQKINGFFALAIHDKQNNTVFISRDRMGIKPLFYYSDADKLIFGSELKALMTAGIPKVPDRISILNYLQLNYIPGPHTIFEQVLKLKPGHYIYLDLKDEKPVINEIEYYRIPSRESFSGTYDTAKSELKELLDKSVQRRLVADVPLGAFLSGGIDSSVIVALASQHTKHLNTFSIGYKDEPMYDETKYAKLVAEKYKTNHTVFSLSNDDLFNNLFSVLDYIDEPFADSSALAVNILSMHTRKHVTVALSGDGADEMYGGYNKHRAEWIIRNRRLFTIGMRMVSPLLRSSEGTRGSTYGNKIRQIHRFADGASLTAADRYWRWCGFLNEKDVDAMIDFTYDSFNYFRRKKELLKPFGKGKSLNDVLNMDMHMVLPNDMLVKVDLMSMANSLEVRVPFLDYEVVNHAFSLPVEFKIDQHSSKKILRETFRKELPAELFNRPKHGFEVPMLKWMRTDLRSLIEDDLLSADFIDRQGLFNISEINFLKKQLFSGNPGEIEARMWGLIVFQYWWKKYMD
ncbi:MAG: asparagine synthase (glutamine-hydrolyzing) [Bacteroidota bacterium]|nr:asparagine synthase (glutamine-hydrolyzing) [Bacteroidota bacterium]